MKGVIAVLMLLTWSVLGCSPALASAPIEVENGLFDVVLGWSHEEPERVSEYKIHYGTDRNNMVNTVTVKMLNGEVLGLTRGVTYYFAVTAVNQWGNESGFSNVVWTDGTEDPKPCPAPDGCFIEIITERR